MKNSDKQLVSSMIAALSPIAPKTAQAQIESESSYDESVVLGTPEDFLALALKCLKMALLGDRDEAIQLSDVFSDEGAVWIVSGETFESEDRVQMECQKFKGG